MYATKKNIDRKIDIKQTLQFIGLVAPNLYLAHYHSQPQKKLIVKVIALPHHSDINQLMMQHEAILRKISASPILYLKPQAYDLRDNAVYLCTPVQHMSLQSLLWIHRKENRTISKEMIRQFAVRQFEGLARLKASDIFPQNMKPSNLFMEERGPNEINWMWGEAGLHTNNYNQYYVKVNLAANKSLKFDPLESQFYTLGIILLQMITLQPVQDIDTVVRNKSNWDNIKNYTQASEYYGRQLTTIIKYLIDPPKDNSLYNAVQQYKNFVEEEEQNPEYKMYQFTADRLEGYIKNEMFRKIEEQAKEYIKSKNLSVREVFDLMARLDPTFAFGVSCLTELDQLMRFIGIKLEPDQLLFLGTFYFSRCLIRYFTILQKILPTRELIQNIIVKAVDNYDSFKDFFETQTKGRDYWRSEELKQLLDSLEVYFEEKDIIATMKSWSGADKNSVKYDEIYKVFKPILGMSMSLSTFKKPKSQLQKDTGESALMKLMEQLMKKQPDLVTFFRKHDLKQNWIVDYKIQKILRNYTKVDQDTFKRAMTELWQKGSIPGDLSRQINYIYLIRNLQIYDNVELLRKIITQKVNQTDRDAFFNKYKKEQDGWSYLSFVDFNVDENLEFEERQLKQLFRELDQDNSGSVQQKELYYRLTGLKEFDYEGVVQSIDSAINRRGIFLFDNFKDLDPKARLVLGHPSQLQRVLNSLGVQLAQDHLAQLYHKFSRSGKFDYMSFCLQFHKPAKLFIAATKFAIYVHYRNDFEKLFVIGLRDGRKKWNRQSLTLVNQELVLGFRENSLSEVWKVFDPNDETSLTKEEVSKVFSYHFEQAQQLQPKKMDNIHDYARKKQNIEDLSPDRQKWSDEISPQKTKDRGLMDQFGRLGERKLQNLPIQMLKESQQHNGKIDQEMCLKIMQEHGLKFTKSQALQIISRFKASQTSRRVTINYIGLYFFIIDTLYRQDFPKYLPKYKANLCIAVIKHIKKAKNIPNTDLFRRCRLKDKMRVSDFQDIFRELIDVDVYGDDIEQAWSFWGEQYLTPQDFDRMLETNEYKGDHIDSSSKDNKLFKMDDPPLGKKKSRADNHMSDFIRSQENSIQTPTLDNRISFGDRQTARFDNDNNRGIRGSFGGIKEENKGRFDYSKEVKGDSSRRDMEKSPTGRFGQRSQEKSRSMYGQKPVEEKLELDEIIEKGMLPQDSKTLKSTKTKDQLFQLLRRELDSHGEQYLNELFAKQDKIQPKRFISCLSIHYNFSEEDANALAEGLTTFGQIKLSSLKSRISKSQDSPNRREYESRKKQRKPYSRVDRDQSQLDSKLSPSKYGDRGNAKLVDPRRVKVNIPVIKDHIKMLISSFCKRFQLSQLQGYFFGQKDHVSRQQFVNKCQSVGDVFKGNISHKIFDYLKPDSHDRVSILSFKLAMNLQGDAPANQQDYLPEQLEKQLKIVFEKADRDHSGFIEPHQIEDLLSSLGFNENLKEIQNYFARMDQNFDNKISYSEFRRFIEDQILPQVSTFDEEEEQLEQMLRNNDIFRHGSIAGPTLQALLQRYGVRVTTHQIQILLRGLNPQANEVSIAQLMNAVREPTNYSGKVKSILYKIRLRKKVQLRQVQKVFESISTCFVLAYTSSVIYRGILSISSPYKPVLHDSTLFYDGLMIKDIRKVGNSQESLLGGQITNNDILLEVHLKQITGVPIPQRAEIKGNIAKRYINVSIFDLSGQSLRFAVWKVEVEWDQDVEDVWRFSNDVRSLIIKISGYEPRKFEKYVLLFELVIAVVEGNRTLQINCGCANMPLRQLLIPEGKTTKKLQLIAGLPNRSKKIDETSISKRGGWKSFFGGQVQSQLQIELIHQKKFEDLHKMIAALPPQIIINRKALHYLWTSSEYMAGLAYDAGQLNRFLGEDLKIITFLLTLDVPELFDKIWLWWKQKIEPKAKTLKTAKNIFRILMQQLYLIVHSNQFELLQRYPAKSYFHHKSLIATRNKLIGEVLENMEAWLYGKDSQGTYKRKKNYGLNYKPLQLNEVVMPKEQVAFMESLARLAAR